MKLCKLPLYEYIQIVMTCLSTHPNNRPRDDMQTEKRQNLSYFFNTLIYLRFFGGQITVIQILARSQRVRPGQCSGRQKIKTTFGTILNLSSIFSI